MATGSALASCKHYLVDVQHTIPACNKQPLLVAPGQAENRPPCRHDLSIITTKQQYKWSVSRVDRHSEARSTQI